MEKTNYDKLCQKEISNMIKPKKLLLHSCCAPCSSQVITYLSKYFDITILYYNPNIAPFEEYDKRKKEQLNLINKIEHINKLDFIDCDYENNIYENTIKGYEKCPERGSRCTLCFKLRLEKTAEIAKEKKFDYFTTTLTISPYKNEQLINEIGENLSKKYNIRWLYSDFKKNNGYKKSIDLSKKYNLYRQNYCGCVYSKRERELKEQP